MSGSRSLRIGIDGSLFTQAPRGHTLYAGRLCRELARSLPEAEFFVYAPGPVSIGTLPGRWTIRDRGRVVGIAPLLWLKALGGPMIRRDKLDVFWSPYSFLPTLPAGLPAMLTIYDFTAEVTPASIHPLHRWAFRRWQERDVRRADAILTISRYIQREIRDRWHRDALVIRPGVDERFQPVRAAEQRAVLNHHGLHRPYILAVAAWDPRKNLELLLRAFLGLRAQQAVGDHELVLVGRPDRGSRAIRMLLGRPGAEAVRCLGYVPEEELPALYSGARLFAFPSSYEGYGMPVAEAIQCGVPVLASDIPPLREAGGEGCTYVAPTEDGLRQGIRAALSGPRSGSPGPRLTWADAGPALAHRLSTLAGAAGPVAPR